MRRGGPQISAHPDANGKQQDQQKQKKRLSFRDPEVEGPQRNSYLGGCRSKTLARPTNTTPKVTLTKKISSSVEDLSLEDQALQIAQDVGHAFLDLSVTDRERADFLGSFDRETEIRDSSPSEATAYHPQQCGFKISTEDQEYLDTIVPPQRDLITMRVPSAEYEDEDSTNKNCIPGESSFPEGRSSSSMQHQIQLLRYQLHQQNQQTEMALHQVQLLQDQMDAENVARRKAQEQNNQLMQQNKELLNHMEKLFQQIEELEKQVQVMEQEKRSKRALSSHEPQMTSIRQPTSYAVNRRPSTEKPVIEKPVLQNRPSYASTRKNSLALTKPLSVNSKPTITQNSIPSPANRKSSITPQRSYTVQNKTTDSGTKSKDTLRIGDTSPPVQSGTMSPFVSTWKLKTQEGSSQSNTEKIATSRSRAGSFSSFIKKPQEGSTVKSTLFSSSSSLSSTGETNKKYSSSTSDLYNVSSAFQGKSSLMIEEPSTGVKSAVSNLSLSSTSKLPRYQPYTGWQRRTSLTNDTEPISAISKDSYKNTSLFNR